MSALPCSGWDSCPNHGEAGHDHGLSHDDLDLIADALLAAERTWLENAAEDAFHDVTRANYAAKADRAAALFERVCAQISHGRQK